MTQFPLQSRLPRTYPITSVRQDTPQVHTYTLPVSLNAKPGQFLLVWLPGIEEAPLSVAGDDGTQTTLTVFAVGNMTKALAERKAGDLIGIRGPFGTHFTWKKGDHIVLVAGGYGSAPLFFTAQKAVEDGCTMDVVLAARDKEHLIFLDQLQQLKNTVVHVVTDDGSAGRKGLATDVLEELIKNRTTKKPIDMILSCGPEMMLKHVSDIAWEAGIPAQVSISRFMKCGYGLCGQCTVDPLGLRLCVEGPVVTNEVAQTITDFGHYTRDAQGNVHRMDQPQPQLHHHEHVTEPGKHFPGH